ncbi:MAG: hypothetical protein H7240_09465 [Glaciimonas sp.]|nr:hypothetical protein [Glaciimonas sp.]
MASCIHLDWYIFIGLMRDVDRPAQWQFSIIKMQESLNKRLPFTKRYLGLIEVIANYTTLALDEKQGHLIINMDVKMGLPLADKSWNEKLSMSGVITLNAARTTVLLNNIRLDNMDNAYIGQVTQIGVLLAREVLQTVPLYSFKPEDLRYVGVTFVPVKIVTKSDRLVVTFEPQK